MAEVEETTNKRGQLHGGTGEGWGPGVGGWGRCVYHRWLYLHLWEERVKLRQVGLIVFNLKGFGVRFAVAKDDFIKCPVGFPELNKKNEKVSAEWNISQRKNKKNSKTEENNTTKRKRRALLTENCGKKRKRR